MQTIYRGPVVSVIQRFHCSWHLLQQECLESKSNENEVHCIYSQKFGRYLNLAVNSVPIQPPNQYPPKFLTIAHINTISWYLQYGIYVHVHELRISYSKLLLQRDTILVY